MNIRHSKSYRELALAAGRKAGLAKPTPEKVAADEGAREARDALWREYERLLADSQTYTLSQVIEWLRKQGIAWPSQSSADRDRRAVLSRERRLALTAEKTRRVLEAMKGADESEVMAAARGLAGQHIFEFFLSLPGDALEDLKPGEIIRLFEVAGKLSKAHADVGLIEQRMRELREKFEAKAKGVRAQTKDGRLTQEQIDEISREVFGSAAA